MTGALGFCNVVYIINIYKKKRFKPLKRLCFILIFFPTVKTVGYKVKSIHHSSHCISDSISVILQKSKEFGRKAEEAVSRFFNKAAGKDRLEVHTVFRSGDTACGNDTDISVYRNLA